MVIGKAYQACRCGTIHADTSAEERLVVLKK